jgi:hypothetical protein
MSKDSPLRNYRSQITKHFVPAVSDKYDQFSLQRYKWPPQTKIKLFQKPDVRINTISRDDCTVGTATSCGLNSPGFQPRQGKETFSPPKPPRPYLVPTKSHSINTGILSQGQAAGRHDHSSSAEVKNNWRFNSTPLYVFIAWTGTTLPFFYTSTTFNQNQWRSFEMKHEKSDT